MSSEQEAKTFFFEGNPVGYFCADELPTTPGQYQYMPYRGVGHSNLGLALSSRGPQRCHYLVAGERQEFTVKSTVSYGRLDLSDFS
jgi:hypothetical protein